KEGGRTDVFTRFADGPTAATTAAPAARAGSLDTTERTSAAASYVIPAARRGEWPSFRGVDASGVAADAHPPTSWDLGKGINIRWKTPIPGLAHSSPIVWGDRVFVTTSVPASEESLAFRHGASAGS